MRCSALMEGRLEEVYLLNLKTDTHLFWISTQKVKGTEWRNKNLLHAKLSNEFINLKTALNIHSKSIGTKLNITH